MDKTLDVLGQEITTGWAMYLETGRGTVHVRPVYITKVGANRVSMVARWHFGEAPISTDWTTKSRILMHPSALKIAEETEKAYCSNVKQYLEENE